MAAEGAAAPQVADRIDAPGDVVNQKNPGASTPEESEQSTRPAHGNQSAQQSWYEQADQHPQGKQAAQDAQHAILLKVGDVAINIGSVAIEDPAHMCVPQALEHSPEAAAMHVGRMGIVVLIRMLVVAAMLSNPLKKRTFHGH